MSFWTYLGQIINFLAFVVILHFLLYKPVRRLMQQRKEDMESQLREAENKLKDAETLRADTEKQARELDEKRDSILKQAREQADAQRKELLEQAETLARERLERFRRIMDQERSEVLENITGDLRDTILEVAASALGDASPVLTGRALEQVEKLLAEMPDHELDNARKALNDLENRVQVRSAKPLTEDEATRLKSVLSEKLGVEKLKLEIDEDPSLVGGFEVALGHIQLVAHWRGMIEDALQKQHDEIKQVGDKETKKETKPESEHETPKDTPE